MNKKELERNLNEANENIKKLNKKVEILSFIVDNPMRCTLNVNVEFKSFPTCMLNNVGYGNTTTTSNDWYYYCLNFRYYNKVSNNIEDRVLLKSSDSFVVTSHAFDIGSGQLSALILTNDNEIYQIKYASYDRCAHPQVYKEINNKWIKVTVLEDTPKGRFLVL